MLVADRLSTLLLLVSAVVALCVLVYSVGQGIIEFGRDTPLSVFYPTFLVLCAGVSNAFLAGDLFNLYVGFEILLAASYVLITLGGSGPRLRAGATYVVVAVLSSVVFLIAIAAIYAVTGTVNLADLAEKLRAVPEGVQTVLRLLLLSAFAIKAAVFPLSAWLPDSYPTAPAPVTAVFAGLLTKVGVYAMIRTQTLLFPDHRISSLLLWAALATMLVGILGAVAQSDIKRMLSFTLVSHIGYMVFGIALASELGLASSIFYTVHHITIQTTLFLVAGLIEIRGGSTSLEKLGGLARAAPVLALMFFIPAMNLAGIPPFSGFFGKVGLAEAGVARGQLAGVPGGRRVDGDQPADPLGDREDLEPGLLEAAGRAGRRRRPALGIPGHGRGTGRGRRTPARRPAGAGGRPRWPAAPSPASRGRTRRRRGPLPAQGHGRADRRTGRTRRGDHRGRRAAVRPHHPGRPRAAGPHALHQHRVVGRIGGRQR